MKQVKCLTSMRFFAAAMIVLFHSVNAFSVWDNRKITYPLAQGVSFFFVLSGFILTYVYPNLSGDHRTWNFYVARVARIWPAHLSAFFLLLGLIPVGGWTRDGTWQILLANLFLVHGWIPIASFYFSFNNVSWSVSTETFFYLAFPYLISELSRNWWWKLLCTAAFVVAILRLTDFLKVPEYSSDTFSVVTSHGLIYINPLVRILEFVFGMTVATLCLRWRGFKSFTSLPEWLWTVFEFGALAVTLWSGLYGIRLLSSLFDGRSQYAFTVYAGACGSFPAFGLLIGVFSFERGIISRFLSMSWLVLLGEISYSLYLVHYIVIRWYSQNAHLFASVPKAMRYVFYWLVVLSLSFIIWRFVEKPSQQWIRSLFSKRDPTAPKTNGKPSAC